MTVAIPELDLAEWRERRGRVAFADRMRSVCHEIGFFQLVGHGVDQALIDEHAVQRERFFALPDAAKEAIDKASSPHFRGWERVGAELTGGRTDWREQLDLATEHPVRGLDASPAYLRLDGPNQIPGDDVLPGFGAHLAAWFAALSTVADMLLDVFSVALGQPESTLRQRFGARPFSLVKLIRYPPTPPGEAGVNPHKDSGFLTLLLQHDTPGLQIEAPTGDWIDVPPQSGAFVVNIGEMLQQMTGNYFVATTHRVLTGAPRQSSGWFHGPDLTTPLDPLPLGASFAEAVAASPRHANAGFMSRHEEIAAGAGGIGRPQGAGVFGEQLWNYYRRSYPDHVARHHPDAA